MGWLPMLVSTTPGVQIAGILLATIGGLFGYHALAQKPASTAHQLVSALSAGLFVGSGAFIADALMHRVFSDTIRELLAIPPAALPASLPAAIYFGLFGFSLGLTPTLRTLVRVAQGAAQSPSFRLVSNVWAVVVQSVALTVAVQIALVKLHVLGQFQPPLMWLVIVTVAFVVLRRVYRLSRRALLQRLRSELEGMPREPEGVTGGDPLSWKWVGRWASWLSSIIVGGLIFGVPVTLASLAFLFYFASVLGWGLLLYGAVLLAAYLVWRILHYGADHLSRRWLGISGLALVLVAAGLQLYQALAG